MRLQFAFLQCAFVTAIWFFGSWMGITGFLLQAGVTVFLLETVSYIENYGLLRAKSADGKCEICGRLVMRQNCPPVIHS